MVGFPPARPPAAFACCASWLSFPFLLLMVLRYFLPRSPLPLQLQLQPQGLHVCVFRFGGCCRLLIFGRNICCLRSPFCHSAASVRALSSAVSSAALFAAALAAASASARAFSAPAIAAAYVSAARRAMNDVAAVAATSPSWSSVDCLATFAAASSSAASAYASAAAAMFASMVFIVAGGCWAVLTLVWSVSLGSV